MGNHQGHPGDDSKSPSTGSETHGSSPKKSSKSSFFNSDSRRKSACLIKLFQKLELTAEEDNHHPGELKRATFENAFHGPMHKFGKLLYVQMASQHGSGDRERITKEQFVKAGKELLKMFDDDSQHSYYFRLFSAGKEYLNKEDALQMVNVAYALTLSASMIPYSKSDMDNMVFTGMVQGMFGVQERIDHTDFKKWTSKHCPHIFCGVHNWVYTILTGSKMPSEQETAPVPLLEKFVADKYIMSMGMLWALSIVIPQSYTHSEEEKTPTQSTKNPLLTSYQLIMKMAQLSRCQSWNLLYDSEEHGLSHNRFTHHVSSYHAHTITLVSFEGRNIYCVAVDKGWRSSSERFGGEDTMVLQITPVFRVVQAGGPMVIWNEHSRNLKQGVYVGKEKENRVLFIASDFDAVDHYGVSCALNKIEIWGCGAEVAREAQVKQKQWEKKETDKHAGRKIMGRKRCRGVRQKAEMQVMRMRARRAAQAARQAVFFSEGWGEPSLSEGKLPNAPRLVTPRGSLSTPCRGVPPRSDSPLCVCTPPSVPPVPTGAGQTTATDSVPTVCTSSRVPSLLCDAVVLEDSAKVTRSLNESKNKPLMNKSVCTLNKGDLQNSNYFTSNVPQNSKKKVEEINERRSPSDSVNEHLEPDVGDVVFVQETGPELYAFKPLCMKSQLQISSSFQLKRSDTCVEQFSDKAKLGKPKKIKEISGDGNCFFRALSYCVCNIDTYHMFFRRQIVNHMLSNDAIYAIHLRSAEQSVSNYVLKQGMLHNGTWATEVEILAAADLLKTDIYIYEETTLTWLKFSANQVHTSSVSVMERSIYLIHKFQAHYDVVVDVMESKSVETLSQNNDNVSVIVQGDDFSEQADILPKPVQGHFDQNHPQFFNNAGKQCVMNCLSALILSHEKCTLSWTPNTLDFILINGNEMYTFLQHSSTMEHEYIAIHEIPRYMEYNGELYYFTFQESLMGTFGNWIQNSDDFQLVTLKEALTISLQQSNISGVFVTFRLNTFIIIKQNQIYCIFDSHSRSVTGMLDPNGTSIVIHHSSLHSVLQHCLELAESLACQANDVFEVTAVEMSKADPKGSSEVNITSRINTSTDQNKVERTEERNTPAENSCNEILQSYFQDQERKKNVWQRKIRERPSTDKVFSISTGCRREYMQKYMKAIRQTAKGQQLREKEKKRKIEYRKQNKEKTMATDRNSKQRARLDPKYLETQRRMMSIHRENHPNKSKTTDLTSKQKARNNPQYLETERRQKSCAREIDHTKHRAIDRKSKQQARNNPQNLEKHRKMMSSHRENNPNKSRTIDIKSKQKARNNPQYLETERRQKSCAREIDPTKQRAINRKSKQRARKNPQNLEKHRKMMSSHRENNPNKSRTIDIKSKQQARSNPQYLETERRQKSSAREIDPTKQSYRSKE